MTRNRQSIYDKQEYNKSIDMRYIKDRIISYRMNMEYAKYRNKKSIDKRYAKDIENVPKEIYMQ